MHSKYLLILTIFLVCMYIFGVNALQIDTIKPIQFVPDNNPLQLGYKYTFDALAIILACSIILCVNKTCFRLILKSSEFWFKTWAVLQWSIWLALYKDDWDSSHLALHILDKITVFLLTVCMSLLDALQISQCVKVVSGVIVAAVWTVCACYYTFYDNFHHNDTSVISMTLSGSDRAVNVSCIQLAVPSVQVLAVLFWKQTLFMWLRKGRTASISYHPFIDWTDNTQSAVNAQDQDQEVGDIDDSYDSFSISETEEIDHHHEIDIDQSPLQLD